MLNRYVPREDSRSMHDNAMSMWAGIYSKDKLANGSVSPARASNSTPSTSILQNFGDPYFLMSVSKVYVFTSIFLFQTTFENRSWRAMETVHQWFNVDIAGVFVLTKKDWFPICDVTAASTSTTRLFFP